MEIDLQPQKITGYTVRQIQGYLGVGKTRLTQYCKLLREACPGEFDHPVGSSLYSTTNYRALKKVRTLFRLGATETQVKQTLRLEGWE
jgi:hypothetical protein